MTFNINQIEKEVNYIFSSYPRHDMISMSKAQTYRLINRVKELEKELQRDVVEEWDLMKQNKRYRETIEELLDDWKENVKITKQHNKTDYDRYRTGLIEGLEYAMVELEQALEESE